MIRRLGQRFAELRVQAEEARKTIARHDDQIKRQEKEQADLEQPRDVEPLRRAVKQARKAGDLDARLADARGKYARAEKKATTALAQLPGWSQSAEELQRLAVPLSATLDQFESQLADTARQRQSLAERMAAEDDVDPAARVPIADTGARARRAHRRGAHGRPASGVNKAGDWSRPPGSTVRRDGEAVARVPGRICPGGDAGLGLRAERQRGDALADRLRREADRVAHKAESMAQLNRHRTTREGLERESQLLNERQASINREWNALVVPLAIEDRIANAGRAARLASTATKRWSSSSKRPRSFVKASSRWNRPSTSNATAIGRALDEVGEPLSTADSDLAEVSGEGRGGDQAARRPVPKTREAGNQAGDGPGRAGQRRARALETAKVELTAWRTEWSVMMARIGLEAEATP